MGIVAVKKCENYKIDTMQKKLTELLDFIGGLECFVKKGDTVLLKINLLMGKDPAEAVTTHPLLVKALAEMIVKRGARVIIADSPGGPFKKAVLKRFYKKAGFIDICREPEITLNFNTDYHKVEFSDGKVSKSFMIADFVDQADVIINLPKLKTHGLTMMTAAVKNIFGVVPGLLKSEYHLKTPSVEDFCDMLLDLAFLIKPDLNIMDAITGMEGEGPSGGNPRDFNYLMASTSAMELDIAAAHLLGINPASKVPTIKKAAERGLITDFKKLKLAGDELSVMPKVKIPVITNESNLIDQYLPVFLQGFFNKILRPRPVVKEKSCTGCGTCVTDCPAHTIELKQGKASIELDNCIRCFCCQELCEYRAIEIKRPLAGKLLFRL